MTERAERRMNGRRLAMTAAIALALVAGVVVIAWLAAEQAMDPNAAERRSIALLFGGIGLVSALVAVSLHQAVRGSLRRRLALVAVVGPVLVAAAFLSGASSMFLSNDDLQFSLILIALAAVLATGIAVWLVGSLSSDLMHLRHVAEQVGAGDRTVRAGIDRPDELGELSDSFDAMVARLADAEADRDRIDDERSVMLAALSHDVRTPLAAMRAALEALQDGLSPDPDRYLASMATDLDAVESMVDDLFLLGRLDSGALELRREPLDVAELVEATVEAMSPLAELEGVQLRNAGTHQALVMGESSGLGRVLRNLVDNAIRHSPAGGVVTLDVETGGAGSDVVVAVSDEGDGFDAEFVEVAFERFQRAEEARPRARGGAGLGLAVAAEIVRELGGRIWADPGPGGRVSFSLPGQV